jgi:hypothetical protein
VLQSRLNAAIATPLLAVSLVVLLTACSGSDGPGDELGALEENVVAPGITAIDASTALACQADADVLRTALETFELVEGAPAESEGALVAAGHLADESELFDVVDGQIVAVAGTCKGEVVVTTPAGETPVSAPATDLGQIVTEEDLLDAEGVFEAMTPADIAGFGGEACARELADIFAAAERFVAREGRAPESLADVADDLGGEVSLWELDASGDILVPAAGSPCPDVFSTP